MFVVSIVLLNMSMYYSSTTTFITADFNVIGYITYYTRNFQYVATCV